MDTIYNGTGYVNMFDTFKVTHRIFELKKKITCKHFLTVLTLSEHCMGGARLTPTCFMWYYLILRLERILITVSVGI